MDDVPLTEKDISAIKAASTILHQFKNTTLFNQYQFAIDKILDRAVSSQENLSPQKIVFNLNLYLQSRVMNIWNLF